MWLGEEGDTVKEEGGGRGGGRWDAPALNFAQITAAPGVIEVNPEFEIAKITDLLELSNWAHHTSYILPQVRTPHHHTSQHLPSYIHTYTHTQHIPPPFTGTYNLVQPSAKGRRRV